MVAVEDVVMLLRALKGPELACLVAILMSPKPARIVWLKSVTGLSDHTVSMALTNLRKLGLAQDDGRRSKWVPAGGFCEAFLKRAVEGLGVGERPALSPSGLKDGPPSSLQDGPPSGLLTGVTEESERGEVVNPISLQPDNGEEDAGSAPAGASGENPGEGADRAPAKVKQRGASVGRKGKKRRRRGGKVELGPAYAQDGSGEAAKTPANRGLANRGPAIRGPANRGPAIRGSPQKGLSQEEEEIKPQDLNSASGLSAGEQQNAAPAASSSSGNFSSVPEGASHKARTRRILAATQLLFGEMVLGPPERYPDLDLLLGSIAEAYSQRQRLRNPARVVYSNLSKGALPAQPFLDDPLAHLPERFLVAAGLAEPGEASAEAELTPESGGWEDSLASLAQEEAPACQPDASLELPVGEQPVESGGRSACQAWQAVRSALLSEMPLSSYKRYIEPLELVRFDPSACVFILASQDEFERKWLEERMQRMLEHLLSGICNRPARIGFIG